MGTQAFGHTSGSSRMSHAVPIVFVVDDDVSVRESLELLIRCEGWEPQTFASALEFLARPRALVPSYLVLDISLPGLTAKVLPRPVSLSGAAAGTPLEYHFMDGVSCQKDRSSE
jgi:hypothetical protein